MPRVGPIYTLPPGYFATPGTTILTTQHNPPLEDIAQALTNSLASDGATPLTGNLQMNANKITGLAAGTNPGDAVRFDQVPNLTGLTASVAELNILDGATLTTTELNYVDGVTSAIQTQLDGKAPVIADPGADRIRFWDDSAGAEAWLEAGAGLAITGTTIATVDTGPVLLETLTMTGTSVTMAQVFKADKSYLFEMEDVAHDNAATRILTVAFYGETAAAFGTAQATGSGIATGEFYYATQVLYLPKRVQKFKSLSGVNFVTSSAVGSNAGTNYTSGRLGAMTKWGVAQSVSHVRFALDGAGNFNSGTIKIWEF